MSRAWTLAGCLGATLLLRCGADGCRAPATATSTGMEVAYAGCAGVRAGPICEAEPGQSVRLAVRATADAPPEVTPAGGAWTEQPGGWWVCDVPVSAGTEAIALSGAGGAWQLPIAPVQRLEALERATRLRAERRLDEAVAIVDGALADEAGSAGFEGRLLGLRARLDLSRGDHEAGVARFRVSIPRHRTDGRPSDALRDTMALAHTLATRLHRIAEAREALADADADVAGHPEGRAILLYYRAVVARRAGDPRGALRDLGDLDGVAQRLGLRRLARDGRELLAMILIDLGRGGDAARILEAQLGQLPADADACVRARVLVNLAWARLGAGQAREARPALEEALAARQAHCRSPSGLRNVLVNLALCDLQAGDPAAAGRRLAEARELGDETVGLALWSLDVAGRVARGEARLDEALAAFEELAELAATAGSPDASRRAALGRAEALVALGRPEEARSAFEEAERFLDEALRRVPLGEGRAAFLGSEERGARGHVDLLVRQGRAADALVVARRSRAREVRLLSRMRRLVALSPERRRQWDEAVGLWRRQRAELDAEAADDWKLARDQRAGARARRRDREARLRRVLDDAYALVGDTVAHEEAPPPAPGELVLAFHPGADGWIVLAATEDTVRAERIGGAGGDPVAVAGALLEALAGPIGAARRLTLLPYGDLRDVDFHALPWRGDVLAAHVPVRYAVDVGHRAEAARTGAPAGALLVADPRADLQGARAELDVVGRSLPGAVTLVGREATRDAVGEALRRVAHLHFAGHGTFGGAGGWQSALRLSGDEELTLGDILALPAAPPRVVLSGCETGRAGRAGPGATLGLAQALVIAGSEAVIAAVRPVDDALALDLARHLYRDGGSALAADPARALRDAGLALRAARPDADWASYRLVVP